ncbi:hypothetical protein JZ751_014525 [Albula glossodonta]|uniref:Uncharacterized protein n=1 Tax=Albula glossodonta TaxID=121402 RepID=A0A8T2N7E8_9TELE|nr:hypothetical protein JZ751_014525 [Albula glossodonta]
MEAESPAAKLFSQSIVKHPPPTPLMLTLSSPPHPTVTIYSIWFYDKSDCQRIAQLMARVGQRSTAQAEEEVVANRCVKCYLACHAALEICCPSNQVVKQEALQAQQAPPDRTTPSRTNGCVEDRPIDILELLSRAKEEYQRVSAPRLYPAATYTLPESDITMNSHSEQCTDRHIRVRLKRVLWGIAQERGDMWGSSPLSPRPGLPSAELSVIAPLQSNKQQICSKAQHGSTLPLCTMWIALSYQLQMGKALITEPSASQPLAALRHQNQLGAQQCIPSHFGSHTPHCVCHSHNVPSVMVSPREAERERGAEEQVIYLQTACQTGEPDVSTNVEAGAGLEAVKPAGEAMERVGGQPEKVCYYASVSTLRRAAIPFAITRPASNATTATDARALPDLISCLFCPPGCEMSLVQHLHPGLKQITVEELFGSSVPKEVPLMGQQNPGGSEKTPADSFLHSHSTAPPFPFEPQLLPRLNADPGGDRGGTATLPKTDRHLAPGLVPLPDVKGVPGYALHPSPVFLGAGAVQSASPLLPEPLGPTPQAPRCPPNGASYGPQSLLGQLKPDPALSKPSLAPNFLPAQLATPESFREPITKPTPYSSIPTASIQMVPLKAGPAVSRAEPSVLLSPSVFQHSVTKTPELDRKPAPPSPSSALSGTEPPSPFNRLQLQDTLIHLIKVQH